MIGAAVKAGNVRNLFTPGGAAMIYTNFQVVQSNGVVIETHTTRAAADHAVEVLNAHEQRWSEAYATGDPSAVRALRAGRPFSYHVREKGGIR